MTYLLCTMSSVQGFVGRLNTGPGTEDWDPRTGTQGLVTQGAVIQGRGAQGLGPKDWDPRTRTQGLVTQGVGTKVPET